MKIPLLVFTGTGSFVTALKLLILT